MLSGNCISEIQRISILYSLISQYCSTFKFVEKIRLAKQLSFLIDELNFYKIDLSLLEKEFYETFPSHWKQRTHFLHIVTQSWPKILKELGKEEIDPNTLIDSKNLRCISFGISKKIDISRIKNKINILESENIYQEVDFIIELVKNNQDKIISIIAPNQFIMKIINQRLKDENIFENRQFSKDYIDELNIYFSNIDQKEFAILKKELAYFDKENQNLSKKVFITSIANIKNTQADIFIFSSMNEENWIKEDASEYWLHPIIKKKLNLPIPDKNIIEDQFYSILDGKTEIYITRSKITNGQLSIKSSILSKFELYAKKYELKLNYLEFKKEMIPISKQDTRFKISIPLELSAKNIETLLKDPYSFYARHCLNLDPKEDDSPELEMLKSFKSALFSYFKKQPEKIKFWLEKMKEIDYLTFKKCEEAINWLDTNYSVKKIFATDILGRINVPNKNLAIFSKCDIIESNGEFSTIIKFQKSLTNISVSDILYGDDISMLATAYIAKQGGFGENFKKINQFQIWSLTSDSYDLEPWDIKTFDISSQIIDSFENRIIQIIENFENKNFDFKDIDQKNINFKKYKHLERI